MTSTDVEIAALADDPVLWLLAARKPEAIAELEQKLGITQKQLVDENIEFSKEYFSEFEDFYGYRGTPEERLEAVRRAIWNASPWLGIAEIIYPIVN